MPSVWVVTGQPGLDVGHLGIPGELPVIRPNRHGGLRHESRHEGLGEHRLTEWAGGIREDRFERPALHLVGRVLSRKAKDRWHQVHLLDEGLRAPRWEAGTGHHERHPARLLPELCPFLDPAMLSHACAVVGGEDDDRVIPHAVIVQRIEQPSHLMVDVADQPVVGASRPADIIRGKVRIPSRGIEELHKSRLRLDSVAVAVGERLIGRIVPFRVWPRGRVGSVGHVDRHAEEEGLGAAVLGEPPKPRVHGEGGVGLLRAEWRRSPNNDGEITL